MDRVQDGNDLGPAARNQIDTEFSENNMLSSKFSVIERDKLNVVLKEQGLAMAGAVDPTTYLLAWKHSQDVRFQNVAGDAQNL